MDRRSELSLIDRALRHLGEDRSAGRSTDRATGPSRIPVSRYLDPTRFEAEMEALFRAHPLALGHRSLVPEPGTAHALTLAGRPLLLTRDAQGRARLFLNVCRHRGTVLVEDHEVGACAAADRLICPYHAWTYGLDGRLLGAPHKQGFGELLKDRGGLVELPLEERHGLLFADLRPGAPLDLGAYLGAALERDLAAFGFGAWVPFEHRSRIWRLNYKVMAEGGLEAYHVQVLHRGTIAPLFVPQLALFDRSGPHTRYVMIKKSAAELASLPREERRLRPHANPVYSIFPSASLLVEEAYFLLFLVRPLAPDATRIDTHMYIPAPPRSPRQEGFFRKSWEATMKALDEDFAIGERAQRGFASGANDAVLAADFELGVASFHASVDRALADRFGEDRWPIEVEPPSVDS